jgi:hypothetical protein
MPGRFFISPDHELEITRFLLQLGDRALVLEVVFMICRNSWGLLAISCSTVSRALRLIVNVPSALSTQNIALAQFGKHHSTTK